MKPLEASEATAYMAMCRLVRWRWCRPLPAGIGRLHAKTFVSDSWLPLLLIALSNQMSPSNTPVHTVSESVHDVRMRSFTLGHAASSQYWQKIQFQVSTAGCPVRRKKVVLEKIRQCNCGLRWLLQGLHARLTWQTDERRPPPSIRACLREKFPGGPELPT